MSSSLPPKGNAGLPPAKPPGGSGGLPPPRSGGGSLRPRGGVRPPALRGQPRGMGKPRGFGASRAPARRPVSRPTRKPQSVKRPGAFPFGRKLPPKNRIPLGGGMRRMPGKPMSRPLSQAPEPAKVETKDESKSLDAKTEDAKANVLPPAVPSSPSPVEEKSQDDSSMADNEAESIVKSVKPLGLPPKEEPSQKAPASEEPPVKNDAPELTPQSLPPNMPPSMPPGMAKKEENAPPKGAAKLPPARGGVGLMRNRPGMLRGPQPRGLGVQRGPRRPVPRNVRKFPPGGKKKVVRKPPSVRRPGAFPLAKGSRSHNRMPLGGAKRPPMGITSPPAPSSDPNLPQPEKENNNGPPPAENINPTAAENVEPENVPKSNAESKGLSEGKDKEDSVNNLGLKPDTSEKEALKASEKEFKTVDKDDENASEEKEKPSDKVSEPEDPKPKPAPRGVGLRSFPPRKKPLGNMAPRVRAPRNIAPRGMAPPRGMGRPPRGMAPPRGMVPLKKGIVSRDVKPKAAPEPTVKAKTLKASEGEKQIEDNSEIEVEKPKMRALPSRVQEITPGRKISSSKKQTEIHSDKKIGGKSKPQWLLPELMDADLSTTAGSIGIYQMADIGERKKYLIPIPQERKCCGGQDTTRGIGEMIHMKLDLPFFAGESLRGGRIVLGGGGGKGGMGVGSGLQIYDVKQDCALIPFSSFDSNDKIVSCIVEHPCGSEVVVGMEGSVFAFLLSDDGKNFDPIDTWVVIPIETGKTTTSREEKDDDDDDDEDNPQVTTMGFSAAGDMLATGGDDGKARVWKYHTKHMIAMFDAAEEEKGEVSSVEFSPDSKFLITCGERSYASVWNLKDEKEIHQIRLEHVPNAIFKLFRVVRKMQINSYGSLIESIFGLAVLIRRDKNVSYVVRIDMNTWRPVGMLEIPKEIITRFCVSSDGQIMAMSTATGSILVYAIETMELLRRLPNCHTFPGTALFFTKDDSSLISASADKTYVLLPIDRVAARKTPPGCTQGILRLFAQLLAVIIIAHVVTWS